MSRGAYILAIDIGSSSVRALLYDEAGEVVDGASSRRSHRFSYAAGGRVEADADGLVDLTAQCIDETLGRAAGPAADRGIAGVALCTFWHGLLGVDREGRALTPVITWADSRSSTQAARLRDELGSEAVHQRTGCVLHPAYSPSKLLWFRQESPDIFARAAWWCTIGEYCVRQFLGVKACSLSMASGTGLFDRRECRWDPPLRETLGLEEDRLSPLCDVEPVTAGLRRPFAERWPALRDVPWFPARGDGACSNVGSGCAGSGRLAVMIGTTCAMRAVCPADPPPVPWGLWAYRIDRIRQMMGGVLGDGGNLHEWLGGTLALGQEGEALDAALLAAAPAAHGLSFLPFLTGERSTGWDPAARATVMGMRPDTTALEILQAGMEGVAYRLAAVRDLLHQAAPGAREVIATGGALLKSNAWCQILADVLETPVLCAAAREASSRGAALLAWESLGRINGIEQVPVRIARTFEPRKAAAEAHRAAAREQQRLRDLLFDSGLRARTRP